MTRFPRIAQSLMVAVLFGVATPNASSAESASCRDASSPPFSCALVVRALGMWVALPLRYERTEFSADPAPFLIFQSPSRPLSRSLEVARRTPIGLVHMGSTTVLAQNSVSPDTLRSLGPPAREYEFRGLKIRVWSQERRPGTRTTVALIESASEYIFISDTDASAVDDVLASLVELN